MTVSQILIDKVAESQFNGKPDWEVATILNMPDNTLPTKRIPVATADVRQMFLERQYWAGIVMTADNTTVSTQIRGLCITVRDTLIYSSIIEAYKPATYDKVVQFVDDLLTNNFIDVGTKNDLLAMCVANKSWAEHNSIYITSREVGLARGAIA
jgi:hypothetical protein